jgi:hypothetical protein
MFLQDNFVVLGSPHYSHLRPAFNDFALISAAISEL